MQKLSSRTSTALTPALPTPAPELHAPKYAHHNFSLPAVVTVPVGTLGVVIQDGNVIPPGKEADSKRPSCKLWFISAAEYITDFKPGRMISINALNSGLIIQQDKSTQSTVQVKIIHEIGLKKQSLDEAIATLPEAASHND